MDYHFYSFFRLCTRMTFTKKPPPGAATCGDVKPVFCSPANAVIEPLYAIARILANGVLRLHIRQNELDLLREESVHEDVLTPRGDPSA